MSIKKIYQPITTPNQWTSAHQPIRFVYDLPTENSTLYDHNSEGFLSIWSGIFMDNVDTIKVGGLVYVTTTGYKGLHVITKILGYSQSGGVVTGCFYQTSTPFTTAHSSVFVKLATPPVFSVYKGYIQGETTLNHPYGYSKVSDFSPDVNKDGFLDFDISGFVQAAMLPIQAPRISQSALPLTAYIDYALYMPYRIVIGNTFTSYFMAINGAYNSDKLSSRFVSTGIYLTDNPLEYTHGRTILSNISGLRIYTNYFTTHFQDFTQPDQKLYNFLTEQ
jgi:hypothetical protein